MLTKPIKRSKLKQTILKNLQFRHIIVSLAGNSSSLRPHFAKRRLIHRFEKNSKNSLVVFLGNFCIVPFRTLHRAIFLSIKFVRFRSKLAGFRIKTQKINIYSKLSSLSSTPFNSTSLIAAISKFLCVSSFLANLVATSSPKSLHSCSIEALSAARSVSSALR